MAIPGEVVKAAKRNGIDSIRQIGGAANERMRAHHVVDLLIQATSPGAARGSRRLIELMSLGEWTVISPIHASESDSTPHITITVAGQRYHLRVDRAGCIFDVTRVSEGELIRPSGHKPWVRPGAAD